MGRAPCCDKANVKRGPWSPDEDAVLRSYVERHGTGGNWIALPQKAGLRRCGKSCRLRWLNYLRPDIRHGGFTEEEDNVIYSLYRSMGSRWSVIASHLPGRTDNDVKNYWNTKLKKRLIIAAAGTAQQTPIPSSSASASAVTPFAPPPPLPSVRAEVFDWAAFGFGKDSYGRFLQSDLPPFAATAAANLTANATPENSSAVSSSVENWSASGLGGDDPFLSELGFESYSEFLTGGAYAEVGQVYSSSLAPKPEGLYQRIGY